MRWPFAFAIRWNFRQSRPSLNRPFIQWAYALAARPASPAPPRACRSSSSPRARGPPTSAPLTRAIDSTRHRDTVRAAVGDVSRTIRTRPAAQESLARGSPSHTTSFRCLHEDGSGSRRCPDPRT